MAEKKMNRLSSIAKKLTSAALSAAIFATALPMMMSGTEKNVSAAASNAPAPTMTQIENAMKANTGYYGMAKIVDGDVYVWGQNRANTLGINKYFDSNANKDVEVTTNTIVPFPVKIPDGTFDGKVVQISMNWDTVSVALTDQGSIYGWSVVGYLPNNAIDKSVNGSVPKKIDTSAATGKIVKLSLSNRRFFAQDENGRWYSAGSHGGYCDLKKDTDGGFGPIADEYIQALGVEADGSTPRQIKDIIPAAINATAIICTDGTMFMAGQNSFDCLGNDTNFDTVLGFGNLYNLTTALGGVKFINASAEDTSFTAVDTDGNVWGWGCDHYQKFTKKFDGQGTCQHGQAQHTVSTPVKVYDASIYGKKALISYVTMGNTFIITNDNSVYATGLNANGLISNTDNSTAEIYNPTQIFKEQSQKDTIVGLTPTVIGDFNAVTGASVMIYTLKSDSYFAGTNASGTAGDGTTIDPPPGEVVEVIPDTMPPSKPYTKNGLSFEIEINRTIGNQQKTVKYVASPTNEYPNRVIKTVDNGQPITLNEGMINKKLANGDPDTSYQEAIPAGQTFKLNVYFEDFGKLHTFLVPVRFDPTYVQVVNGAGEAYAKSTVTSAIGKDGAVEQLFTSENWLNGTLASGNEGTYPKVNNKDGWVSVAGHSTAYKAQITDKQAMFSVKFKAIGATPTNIFSQFSVATSKNIIQKTSPDPGYDIGSDSEFDYGAFWVLEKIDSDEEKTAYGFDEDEFPRYTTTISPLKSISLDIVRGENEPVDTVTDIEGAAQGSKAINNKNKDVIYTVKVKPNPTDASFPQVDWTVTLFEPTDGTAELTDYVSIIEQKETYIKFKLPDSFAQTKMGMVRFHAAAKINSAFVTDLDVYIKSFDPPEFIHITEKQYDDNTADATASKSEFIYHNKSEPEDMPADKKENKTYTVTFPSVAEGEQLNKQVTWKLLDKDGNALDTTANTCPVRIITTSPATDSTAASVTIQPLRTTVGEDFVTLRVESLYDPNVYDTVVIKVQFHANDMKFKQEIVRLPFGMGKDLADLLEIGPQDVYETDLEWTYTPLDADTAYINFNGTSSITANETATPIAPQAKYETITVKDKISGQTASVKVAVIDMDSPLNIDDIKVGNLLGTTNDWVQVAANLQVGDIVKFYESYDSASPYITTKALTEIQATPGFPFPVAGLLDSAGGEIAISVTRPWGDSSGPIETSRVPVSYSAEPSKVYGYVALAGKSKTSAKMQGIRVDIDGIGHSETVYTDENGRFEFTEYIKPGNYTLTVSQNRYLTRIIEPNKSAGYEGLVIPATEEFCIATQDAPIKLYAGDVNMDNIIDYRDLDVYVKNWLGQINPDLPDFSDFDYDDNSAYAAITIHDLALILMHYGWPSSKYANWIVPEQ